MAVRFQCPSCYQPIEIDDEWAGKSVGCPYCQKTVAAPDESTLDLSTVPVATPLGTGGASAMYPPPATIAMEDRPNTIALVALVLFAVTLLLLVLSAVVVAGHHLELEEMQKLMADKGMIEFQKALLDKYGNQLPAWLMMTGILNAVALLTSLGSLTCGIIGTFRPRRRAMAIIAIVGSSLFLALNCVGMLTSFAMS